MKRLNITKERFEKSRYFTRKYGTLEYVSESGKVYKTNKGKILKFNEDITYGLTNDELEKELNYEFEIKSGQLRKYKGEGGNVIIPDGVKIIYEGAFEGCSGLTSVIIPDSVTEIWPFGFRGCINLKNVKIGNGVTHIGDWTFKECSNLTSVTIPNSVTYIGHGVFRNCDNLKEVIIMGNPTIIPDAFDDDSIIRYGGKNVSESGKVFKTNKGELLKFVKESSPDSPALYDDEEGRGNSKWVWRLYVTGKGGRSGANDRHHENECMRESKMAFDDVDECVENMFSDFFEECADEGNDSLWGPLFFYPDSSNHLHYGEIDEQKPYNTTKITYYPIGGSENSYGIGKIVMEHDTADYTKWVWIVEKA